MMRAPPKSTLFPYTALFPPVHHLDRHRVGRRAPPRRAGLDPRRAALVHERLRRRLALPGRQPGARPLRSEEHTSELQSRQYFVCRLMLEKKIKKKQANTEIA